MPKHSYFSKIMPKTVPFASNMQVKKNNDYNKQHLGPSVKAYFLLTMGVFSKETVVLHASMEKCNTKMFGFLD